MRMRALVVHGPGNARVDDVPVPSPGPGELLVRVDRAGICGTDVELHTGEMAYVRQGLTHYPLRLGHEWTGTVVAAGSASEGLWVGRRVIGDTMLGCGTRADCRAGRQHVCADRSEVGITDGWPGMPAEYGLIPTRFAHRARTRAARWQAVADRSGDPSLVSRMCCLLIARLPGRIG